MNKKKLKRREEKEDKYKKKDPKLYKKGKTNKNLGVWLHRYIILTPKYCQKNQQSAMGGAGAGDLILHSLCGPVERKKPLTWAAQVR